MTVVWLRKLSFGSSVMISTTTSFTDDVEFSIRSQSTGRIPDQTNLIGFNVLPEPAYDQTRTILRCTGRFVCGHWIRVLRPGIWLCVHCSVPQRTFGLPSSPCRNTETLELQPTTHAHGSCAENASMGQVMLKMNASGVTTDFLHQSCAAFSSRHLSLAVRLLLNSPGVQPASLRNASFGVR